jgi:hypothetical protein
MLKSISITMNARGLNSDFRNLESQKRVKRISLTSGGRKRLNHLQNSIIKESKPLLRARSSAR